MRDLVVLFVHITATLARLLGPGGIRSVVAEPVLIKQKLLILNRSRQRSPNLRSADRLVAALCAFLYRTLGSRKYHLLCSSKRRCKPGPKGPSRELIEAIVQTKQRTL